MNTLFRFFIFYIDLHFSSVQKVAFITFWRAKAQAR